MKSVIARFVAASLVLLVVISACTEMSGPPQPLIPEASSMQDVARLASGRPIVIFVSQRGCEYCQQLRTRVLYPLIQKGELQQRIELREVRLDEGFTLRDFTGRNVTGRAFATRYGVNVTPTLLFLDADGISLADPIVGTGNIEFYETYLKRSIVAAIGAQNLQL